MPPECVAADSSEHTPPATLNATSPARRAAAILAAWNNLKPGEQDIFADFASRMVRIGWPIPAFDGLAAEAAQWADWASRAELRAYLHACFSRLPQAERHRALAALSEARMTFDHDRAAS